MRISDWSSDVCSSDLNRLPFRLKLFGPLAGSAADVGVERAGEASLRRGDDQQMDLILARPCEQLRAFRPDLHLCAESRHHGRKALGVRTAGLSRLPRGARLGGGHTLPRLGLLLGRLPPEN